jgi:hypothetical protein
MFLHIAISSVTISTVASTMVAIITGSTTARRGGVEKNHIKSLSAILWIPDTVDVPDDDLGTPAVPNSSFSAAPIFGLSIFVEEFADYANRTKFTTHGTGL